MGEPSGFAAELRRAIEAWDGLGVVQRFDAETGSWIFIALHDDTLGTMAGGTRMKRYPSPADGLVDAMRLAEGMTHKWAAIDLAHGGGKAVLALDGELDRKQREGLLRRYGRLIEALHGAFGTGPDMGTTREDMLLLAEETRFIHGMTEDRDDYLDPGPFTARGVLSAIRASLQHRFGSPSAAGRTVLLEGLGGVGGPLAKMLAAEGARLILADLDATRVTELAEELGGEGAEIVRFGGEAGEASAQPCDVYAPCAVGGTLNARSIPRLGCSIVAGSANNQLAEPEDADRLARRGVLYAPDYIANGAGAITFGLMGGGEHAREVILRRIDGIVDTLAEIFAEAEREGISTAAAADHRVERILEEGRKKRKKYRL